MLKIREYDDNGNKIDLKELEKFGFEYNDYVGKYVYNIINKPVCVNVWNRIIDIEEYNVLTNIILSDLVYDLTKANLVEKVGDDND